VASWADTRNDQQKLADGREGMAVLADAIHLTDCRRAEPLVYRKAIGTSDLYSHGDRKLQYVFTADLVSLERSRSLWVYDPTVYAGGVMLVIDGSGRVREWTGPQLAAALKEMGLSLYQAEEDP
jgi:hypothetical protein